MDGLTTVTRKEPYKNSICINTFFVTVLENEEWKQAEMKAVNDQLKENLLDLKCI